MGEATQRADFFIPHRMIRNLNRMSKDIRRILFVTATGEASSVMHPSNLHRPMRPIFNDDKKLELDQFLAPFVQFLANSFLEPKFGQALEILLKRCLGFNGSRPFDRGF